MGLRGVIKRLGTNTCKNYSCFSWCIKSIAEVWQPIFKTPCIFLLLIVLKTVKLSKVSGFLLHYFKFKCSVIAKFDNVVKTTCLMTMECQRQIWFVPSKGVKNLYIRYCFHCVLINSLIRNYKIGNRAVDKVINCWCLVIIDCKVVPDSVFVVC